MPFEPISHQSRPHSSRLPPALLADGDCFLNCASVLGLNNSKGVTAGSGLSDGKDRNFLTLKQRPFFPLQSWQNEPLVHSIPPLILKPLHWTPLFICHTSVLDLAASECPVRHTLFTNCHIHQPVRACCRICRIIMSTECKRTHTFVT